jgi:hypothetical protein
LETETRLPIDPSKEEIKIFLSYTHDDISICDRLRKDLSKLGIKVHVDDSDIEFAEPLKSRLAELINQSHATICIVSRRSLKSAWVCWEILQHRESLEKGSKKLIPVFVDDSFFDDDFVNEVGRQANQKIEHIIRLTSEHTGRGEPTQHLDTKRNSLLEMRFNLPFIVDKFRQMNIANLMESEYSRSVTEIYGQLTCGGIPPFPIGAADFKNLDIKARQMEIANLVMVGETHKAAKRAFDYVNDFMARDQAKMRKVTVMCGRLVKIQSKIPDPMRQIQAESDMEEELLDLIGYGNVAMA